MIILIIILSQDIQYCLVLCEDTVSTSQTLVLSRYYVIMVYHCPYIYMFVVGSSDHLQAHQGHYEKELDELH